MIPETRQAPTHPPARGRGALQRVWDVERIREQCKVQYLPYTTVFIIRENSGQHTQTTRLDPRPCIFHFSPQPRQLPRRLDRRSIQKNCPVILILSSHKYINSASTYFLPCPPVPALAVKNKPASAAKQMSMVLQ